MLVGIRFILALKQRGLLARVGVLIPAGLALGWYTGSLDLSGSLNDLILNLSWGGFVALMLAAILGKPEGRNTEDVSQLPFENTSKPTSSPLKRKC